ncbi:MAG: hypothetical protein ABW090_12690 [Sedimenticola sp.]
MKPDTSTAMRDLIARIRASIPFDAPETAICMDECKGCSMKMLEYLASELDSWDYRLAQGETPNFGDLNQLAKSARKIHAVLRNNGLVE